MGEYTLDTILQIIGILQTIFLAIFVAVVGYLWRRWGKKEEGYKREIESLKKEIESAKIRIRKMLEKE